MKPFASVPCAIAAALLLWSVNTRAATSSVPYRGRLERNSTALDEQVALRFALVHSSAANVSCLGQATPGAGCAPWLETQSAVAVVAGEFSVMLGSVTPIPPDVLRAADVYVAVAVRRSTEASFTVLNGLQRLGSVPQAVITAVPNPPVGTVMAWHKNLPGVPALEVGGEWVECNGQTLSDAASPLNGRVIPDLNGTGLFIRGGAMSGVVQQDQMQAHRHIDTGHTHQTARPPHFDSELTGGGLIRRPEGYDGTIRQQQSSVAFANLSNAVAQDGTGIRTGDENRPRNISMVWIIRVR